MTASPQESTRTQYELFLADTDKLLKLEKVAPGLTQMVVVLMERDVQWQQERYRELDRQEHASRLVSIWGTMGLVFSIAGMSTTAILLGHEVSGSILATVDLVALANVLVNSWRRR